MLKNNAPCFIALAPGNDDRRTLVAATVRDVNGDQITLATADSVELKAGGEVVVFAEHDGKFQKQSAKVTRVDSSGGRSISATLTGRPAACDTRGSYRVNVASQNLPIVVGKQPNCVVADVSPEGLGVITPAPLTVGDTVDVDLSVESIYARGTLQVVSERKVEGGKFRYGLRAPGDKKSGIRKSLDAVTNLLHRRQIQRLARAA